MKVSSAAIPEKLVDPATTKSVLDGVDKLPTRVAVRAVASCVDPQQLKNLAARETLGRKREPVLAAIGDQLELLRRNALSFQSAT